MSNKCRRGGSDAETEGSCLGNGEPTASNFSEQDGICQEARKLKKKSPPVTPEMAAIIKRLLRQGHLLQHDIAARFGINPGRVSEINTGKRYAEVAPAPEV